MICYIKWKFREFFIGISNFWTFRKLIWNYYPWDYEHTLDMERKQLFLLSKYMEKYPIHEDSMQCVKRIRLALRLLYIALNYSVDSSISVNTKNAKRFVPNWDSLTMRDKYKEGYLYIEKAWYLYHKLLAIYMRKWWV